MQDDSIMRQERKNHINSEISRFKNLISFLENTTNGLLFHLDWSVKAAAVMVPQKILLLAAKSKSDYSADDFPLCNDVNWNTRWALKTLICYVRVHSLHWLLSFSLEFMPWNDPPNNIGGEGAHKQKHPLLKLINIVSHFPNWVPQNKSKWIKLRFRRHFYAFFLNPLHGTTRSGQIAKNRLLVKLFIYKNTEKNKY